MLASHTHRLGTMVALARPRHAVRLALIVAAGVLLVSDGLAASDSAPAKSEADPYLALELPLEPVDDVPLFRIDGWNEIDSRALVAWGTPANRHLFILRNRCAGLPFAESISFSETAGHVRAGFDQIRVLRDQNPIPCPIARIYRVKADAELKTVKAKIRALHSKQRAEARAGETQEEPATPETTAGD